MQYDDKLITLDNLGTFKGKMEGEIDKASHNLIADEYDGTKTYKVGDVVLHDGFLYECNTAIGTAEEWDPTKWTQVKVTELGGNGGVIEVEDYASLPTVGETGIIYITKDTNKQYRWDATNGYVELSKEEEVEVYAYNDYVSFATFGEERFQKAIKGKLILYWTGNSPFYLSPMGYSTSDGGQVTFGGWRFGVWQHVDSNINKYYYNGFHSTTISRNSGLHGSFSERISGPHSVADVNENFFASNVDPVANGKRLVREMNVVGKLIPTYSSSDAGNVVRVNSSGTEVELDDTATELEVNRLFRTEYTITSTITNGSASGDESIWTKETASVTIVPEYGYFFPKTVTVSGATYSYDGSTGVVSLSAATGAVTITGECIHPNKGDIITLDGGTARYRVLGVSGNEALLLAMDDYTTSAYNSSSVTKTFDGGKTGQKYEGSTLDNLLNTTYYNSLSSNVRNAIVDQTRIQRMYSYKNPDDPSYDYHQQFNFDATKMRGLPIDDQTTIGSRHVFALDVKDIFDYLGKDTMTSAELNEMFFEQTTDVSKYVWLSSAGSDNSVIAFYVVGDAGCVSNYYYYSSYVVRPAFQVDLSNLSWSK